MSERRYAARAMALVQPLSAHLELTYNCNWCCVFCYNPRRNDYARLPAAEWRVVLDDLRALGTLTVTLTGGEPLVHPEFLDIARQVRQRGFALRIFTNGTLVTADLAREIAALYATVEVSLHGATAETHDRATAKPGSFVRVWKSIELLRDAGVKLETKALLTTINEHELDATLSLAREKNLPIRVDALITPRDDGDQSPLQYTASLATRRRVIEIGFEGSGGAGVERTCGGANCGLGRTLLAIDPEGNVYPCMQWRHTSLGNVRRTPLRELWISSAERRDAAATAVAANDMLMHRGGAGAEFAYCPALAFQRTGDPLTPDDEFLTRAGLWHEIAGSSVSK